VWNILEAKKKFELLLVNAHHIKQVPGRKTDQKDSEWIADLLQHGLLRASFVPPLEIRRLVALEGHFTDHHGLELKLLLEFVEFGEKQLSNLDAEIRRLITQVQPEASPPGPSEGTVAEAISSHPTSPLQRAVELWDTIPGIDERTASTLVAEIGVNMDQFPDADHLASWAGLCPGNNESAGKRRSGKTGRGSVWLRRALCQGAWAASHTKDTYLAALYRRLIVRRGKKKNCSCGPLDAGHCLPSSQTAVSLPGARG
jgi:transposase